MDIQDVKPLSMRQNTIYNAIGCLAYQGFQWLITVLVVTLSSGYANSGILAYAMTVGNIFSAVAIYSVRAFQVSDVENKYAQQNYIAFRLTTIMASGLICIAYTLTITHSAVSVIAVLVYLLFKADEAFSLILYGADQKAYRMDYIGVSQFLRGILSVTAFGGVLYLSQSLPWAIGAMFVSCFAVTVFYDLPHARRFGSIVPKITRTQVVELLKRLFPAMVANLLCGLVVSVARQYFNISYGDEALGIYAAVATPSVVVQLLAAYLYSPAVGPIAKRWKAGDRSDLVRFLLKMVGAMLALVVVLVVVLSAVGTPLLTLIYGQSIADYAYLFPAVLVTAGMIVFMWFFSDMLVIFRDFKAVLISNAAAFASTLICMPFFIGTWYMNGINYTIMISYAVGIGIAGIAMAKDIGKLQGRQHDVPANPRTTTTDEGE